MGLQISRRTGERIMIGKEITITIREIRHGRVVIDFEAPKEIPIHRREVFEAIEREEENRGCDS